VLNHHDQVREKIEADMKTYQEWKRSTNFENRIASSWWEFAQGPMRKLRDEIGLKNRHEVIPFMRPD
jgi:hypothetical protein